MNVSFQIANVGNCEIILELMREYYAFDNLPLDETAAQNALKQILADESLGRIWLIVADEKTAGYAVLTLGFSLEYHGRDAFIDEIYLREDFRGQGIGKKALRFLDGKCREFGVRALHLEVERENENARKIYLKNGFADHDRFLMTKWIKENDGGK